MKSFGETVKELRELKGLTQVQLAELCGMGRVGIARLEIDATAPTWLTVTKLAAALGVACTAFPPPVDDVTKKQKIDRTKRSSKRRKDQRHRE
jgi:transcriptional regulator with XRE-family HTH domain